MKGELFLYDSADRLVAFQTTLSEAEASHGIHRGRVCIVLVGGMTDGLLGLPYAEALSRQCRERGITLVQPLLSSSYTGFGVSSLDRDARQLAQLLAFLSMQNPHTQSVYLVGHSTGCQDILVYLSKCQRASHLVKMAFLQGPVSDRDYMCSRHPPERLRELLHWAETQCDAGRPMAIHPELYDGMAPICAQRLRSLLARLGDDDYFSLDLSVEERDQRLSGINVPVKMIISAQDEYYPPGTTVADLCQHYSQYRWPVSEVEVLPGANHAISDPKDQEQFLDYLFRTILDHEQQGELSC